MRRRRIKEVIADQVPTVQIAAVVGLSALGVAVGWASLRVMAALGAPVLARARSGFNSQLARARHEADTRRVRAEYVRSVTDAAGATESWWPPDVAGQATVEDAARIVH